MLQGLNCRVKSVPIHSQISSEKGDGETIQAALQGTLSACCLPWKSPCRISHRCKHRWRMLVITSQYQWLVTKEQDSLALCVPICSVSISKAPGNPSVTCAVQNRMRSAENILPVRRAGLGQNRSVTAHLLNSHGASPGISFQHQNQTHSLWVQSRPGLSLVLLIFWDSEPLQHGDWLV